MANFPSPIKIAPGATRWSLSSLLKYEAERAGEQPPDPGDVSERYLSVRQVAERYSVGVATVWRWCQREAA